MNSSETSRYFAMHSSRRKKTRVLGGYEEH